MRLSTKICPAVLAAVVLGSAAIAQDSTGGAAPSANISAANGPSPGDLASIRKEWACVQERETPGYFQSLNGAEVWDATRSQFYPCATFLGSMDGPNAVYAWRSADSYQGVLFMNNRRPGELYLTGGNNPPAQGVVPPGPFVAKVDATTGKQVWRTYLQNGNVSGEWVGAANLNILPDGNIPIAFGNHLVKLDGDTGLILQHIGLPADAPAEGSNFKHLTIAPDGTLIVKNQTRATPCEIQGTLAAFQCPGGVAASPGSTILAIDPETFEIYDRIGVPENAVTPHTIAVHDGRIAIYAPSVLKFYRFFWDSESKTLSQDTDWVVGDYLEEGQTSGDAPGILGDWVVVQVNGLPSTKAASAMMAISQSDPTKITRIYPFGTDLPTGQSFFEPMNFNTLLSPGYGGRFYYMWDQGFIVLQPMPAAAQ